MGEMWHFHKTFQMKAEGLVFGAVHAYACGKPGEHTGERGQEAGELSVRTKQNKHPQTQTKRRTAALAFPEELAPDTGEGVQRVHVEQEVEAAHVRKRTQQQRKRVAAERVVHK